MTESLILLVTVFVTMVLTTLGLLTVIQRSAFVRDLFDITIVDDGIPVDEELAAFVKGELAEVQAAIKHEADAAIATILAEVRKLVPAALRDAPDA